MITLIKIISVCILFAGMTACDSNSSYTYLIQHPVELIKQVENCQSASSQSKNEMIQCEIAMNAAKDLYPLIKEQQRDPEAFGERILQAEMDLAKIKNELYRQEKIFYELKKNSASANEVKSSEEKVKQLRKEYEDQQMNMKILLSAVGMNKPE